MTLIKHYERARKELGLDSHVAVWMSRTVVSGRDMVDFTPSTGNSEPQAFARFLERRDGSLVFLTVFTPGVKP